jgi:uncharacterized membrane protein
MTKIIIILLMAAIIENVGVVLLGGGLKQIGGEMQTITPGGILKVIKHGMTNKRIIAGITLEAIFFAMLCYLLSQKDVSLVWPLTSLGIVVAALSAKFILNEQVSTVRWAGVVLITIGAMLVSYSEKTKERAAAQTTASVTNSE